MSTLTVEGLPGHVKLNNLVYIFKHVLKTEGVYKFWIKEMADIRGTDLKYCRIEFYGADDAFVAVKCLDGFVFKSGEMKYPLSARVDQGRPTMERPRPRRRSPSPYEYRSRDMEHHGRYEERPRYSGYSRERSRSPLGMESSKLDMEIELLRKQRMIIEEERRLLLERKKLELVKEFGHNALKEFKLMEDDRDRRNRPSRTEHLERPQRFDRPDRFERPERQERQGRSERPVRSEYRPRRASPPRPRRPPPPRPARQTNNETTKLPLFALPCKILMGEMREIMEKLGTKQESFLLNKLVRSTIRKRLVVALEGKPIMSGAKIAALYREQYPEPRDEELIKKLLNDLRICHLPAKNNGRENAKQSSNTGKEDKEQENNGLKEKQTSDADAVTVKQEIKQEPPGWVEQELENSRDGEIGEQSDKKVEYAASLDSSEVTLALHDKNDEDWVAGENGWDDVNTDTEKAAQ